MRTALNEKREQSYDADEENLCDISVGIKARIKP